MGYVIGVCDASIRCWGSGRLADVLFGGGIGSVVVGVKGRGAFPGGVATAEGFSAIVLGFTTVVAWFAVERDRSVYS